MNAIDQVDWNELLQGVQRGEAGILEELMRNLAVRLRPIAKYRLIGWRQEDIDDVLQDTLVTVFEKIGQIASDPDYFALKVLQNKIGNAYQRWNRRKRTIYRIEQNRAEAEASPVGEFTIANLKSADDFASHLESKDLADYIKTAIKELSEFCQTFFLVLLNGRTVQEMWNHIRKKESALSRNAFDKRLYDCRKKLTDLVEDQI